MGMHLRSSDDLEDAVQDSPGSLACMWDGELVKLLNERTGLPSDVITQTLGEALFRCWLYQAMPHEELAQQLRAASPEIHAHCSRPPRGQARPPASLSEKDLPVWELALTRWRTFQAADGLIAIVPAVAEPPEALAIPFRLLSGDELPHRVCDLSDARLTQWEVVADELAGIMSERYAIRVECHLGSLAAQFEGGSFALPVWLSWACREGRLPKFDPHQVFATGAITDGRIEAINGVAAKGVLAQRLGRKLFIAPGHVDAGESMLALRPGLALRECLGAVSSALLRQGLAPATAIRLLEEVKQLSECVHNGTILLSIADRQLKHLKDAAMRLPVADRFRADCLQKIDILQSAIDNHEGRASIHSDVKVHEIKPPVEQVHARAREVVTLTDLGRLEEAAALGEELLSWSQSELPCDATDRQRCQMVAAGVLGGQALLARAVRGDDGCAGRSLELLQRALGIACALEAPGEICRDASQVALWHALLQPENAETECARALQVMEEHAFEGEDEASRAFLACHRWLGGYRNWILHRRVPRPLPDWPLPENGYFPWLLGLALKYRATLRAALGDLAGAEEDFEVSITHLREGADLFGFLRATVQLQAAESLGAGSGNGGACAAAARAAFVVLAPLVEPVFTDKGWLARAEGLAQGSPVEELPDPQRQYWH